MKNIKKYKRIVNKYDLGKLDMSSGRQGTTSVDPSTFQSIPGYTGYDNEAQAYKQSILPQSLSNIAGTVGTLGGVIQGATSLSSAASQNIASAVANGWISNTGVITNAGASAGLGAAGTTATGTSIETALGSSAAKAGLSTIGTIAGAAGALYGGYNLIQGFNNFKNRIHDTDMLQSSSQNIQSKYGRSYKTYGGFDGSGIMNATDAQNKADVTNVALSGAGTGAAIGGTIGSIVPGVGTLIGTGVGALLGGLTGWLFGGSSARKRRERVEREIKNTTQAIEGYNLQAEADAASAGLRDMYNSSHYDSNAYGILADKGKNPNQQSYSTEYGSIVTPSGITKGIIQGYASPDEGEIDMSTGETIYNGNPNPYVKDKRADIVPVGVSGNSDEGAFDRNIAIPGHQRDIDGIMFADKARPYFEDNEYVKQEINKVQNGKGDKVTKKYMLNKLYDKYTANSEAIQQIVDRQSRISKFRQQLNADCGKNAKGYACGKNAKNYACGKDAKNYACGKNARNYACGKNAKRYFDGKVLQPLLGLAARLPYAIADQRAADSEQPYAQNSYVPNSTAQNALNTLASLYYDPSSALYDLVRVGAQNKYNIANTGNLSSGQKAALISASNNQLTAQRYNILTDAYNRNAQYKQAYANALMNYGQSEAMREQQALAAQQEAYRQAVGAKQKLQAQARKNWYTIANQTMQDFSTNDFYNKLIKLYGNDDNIIPTTNKTKTINNKTNNNNIDYFNYKLLLPKNSYLVDKILSNNFTKNFLNNNYSIK